MSAMSLQRAIDHVQVVVTSSHLPGWQANRDAWAVISANLAQPAQAVDEVIEAARVIDDNTAFANYPERKRLRKALAALAQNTQVEAAVEIVEWRENASPRLRFFTKVSNLPAGTKLYLHAGCARVPELMMEQLADAAAALDKLGRRDQCRHLMALHEMLSAPSKPKNEREVEP